MNGKLSRKPWQLGERYGVVVIGSGYGGSITAARLAEQGFDVCVLERGKEWQPGSFPVDLEDVLAAVRSEANPTGLYDYQAGHDLDVFSGNGLGGTSLINANVAIEPTLSVFRGPRWPREIREEAESGALFDYYARARKTLLVERARGRVGDSTLPKKTLAHEKSAGGKRFSLVDITVNHDVNGTNAHGVEVKACTFCGDCVSGCNVGAKGTLATNYLPIAKTHGAAIFTQVEARFVVEAPTGGYYVFVRYVPEGGGAPVDTQVHASVVVVSAGALGSTALLLRSAERGLSLSPYLGHGFSSNGDQLGIGYNNDEPIDSFADVEIAGQPLPYAVGPTITSVIDYRDDPAKDYIVEEGAWPRPLVDALRRFAWDVALADGVDTDSGVADKARELARMLKDQVVRARDGALNHSQVYLGMGHDDSDGRVVLDPDGKPRVIWGAAGDKKVFAQLSDEIRGLVTALGGTYVENPRWNKALGHNPVTVHPLGGCGMGDAADVGVVDHTGRAFRADGSLHAGLYVADGAVVPASVGVNPFLTISALAERTADHIGKAQSKAAPAAGIASVPKIAEPRPGIEFTEKMRGFVTRAVADATAAHLPRYGDAERVAKVEESPLEFRLTIMADDLDRFIQSKEHLARCEGYVDSKLFGKKRLVEQGTFNLFVEDEAAHTKRMIYRLQFTGEDGNPYLLDGFKEIRDDPGFDVWKDTTTLFTSIRAGRTPADPIVAQGIIHVLLGDFLQQLTTFRIRNSPGPVEGAALMGRFGRFFFGDLWDTYILHHVPGVK